MQYSSLDDKDLFERLHKAELSEVLRNDDKWKLLDEARNRIVERAIAKFVMDLDHDNLAKVIEFKIIVKKYKYGLFSEIDQLAQEGEIYFEALKDRGLLYKP